MITAPTAGHREKQAMNEFVPSILFILLVTGIGLLAVGCGLWVLSNELGILRARVKDLEDKQ